MTFSDTWLRTCGKYQQSEWLDIFSTQKSCKGLKPGTAQCCIVLKLEKWKQFVTYAGSWGQHWQDYDDIYSVPMCINNEGVPSSIKKNKIKLEEAGSINAAYSTSCCIKKQTSLNRIRKPVQVLIWIQTKKETTKTSVNHWCPINQSQAEEL